MNQNNIEDIYELSPLQQGMLFHTLVTPNSGMYFEQFCYALQTQVDVPAFQKAWQRVLDRHPILRTSFYWENLDKPYQVVYRQVDLPWDFQDWRELSSQEQEKHLEAFLAADCKQGFTLSQVPLIRLALIQVADKAYQFVFSYHHILMEGWSLTWLWKEFYEFYNAFYKGQDLYLERPRPFREYISWLQQQDISKAEVYWRETLRGFTVPTPLMMDKATDTLSNENEDHDCQKTLLSVTTTDALNSLTRKYHLTLNILLKGAWAILLSRYSGESDIVFGATSSGRPTELAEAESMMGLFANTLPLRVQVESDALLIPWLKKLQVQEVEMRQYEYSPLLQIQQWSEIPRGLPLFESILSFNNYLIDSTKEKLAESLALGEARVFEKTNYPLTIQVYPGSNLLLSIGYDTRRFDSATINRILGHLKTLLEGIVANPEQQLRDLPLLTAQEKYQLLLEWNDTEVKYPQEQCIHELFEAQVERTPDAVAVVFESEQLTYRQLNTKANQLAHYLRSLGVKPEVLVGICVERSLSMVIGLLAILKAGGAYVPLDPAYPPERLAFILQDAAVSVLLTQQQMIENLPQHQTRVVYLDTDCEIVAQQSSQNPISECTTDNLAYIIYTSGSTGQPKGVLVNHSNVVRLLAATEHCYNFNQHDVWTLFHSIAFDFSVWEIWGALLYGGKLVVVPYWLSRSPQKFYQLLLTQQVTVLNQTPSAFRQLIQVEESLENSNNLSLRKVIFGGEALQIESLRPWFERHGDQSPQLINMYGITETTVHVTYRPLKMADLEVASASLIGRPIGDLQIYLLDRYGQPVPIGVPGEMYIGGAGVARGYLNRPTLTSERFIPNCFSNKPNALLYKSGDLARYLPNGDIEYLSRIDNQVKVRGFRIELGEIEAIISQHPAVRETVVVVSEASADSQRIVAYVVDQREQTLIIPELRNFLESKLPNYMMPTAFITLEALPLTPNGKVDHKALPAPDTARPELETVYQPPQTEVEKTIADIWQEVLNLENVGINDNFFQLGGHSLLLVQVHNKLQKIFQRDFLLVEMFQYPTISHLARYFSQEAREETSFIKHSHVSQGRTASLQRRKQARKEHRTAIKEGRVSSQSDEQNL
ncbi:amino acid adenylation domain-containing protein [Nostoc sp. DedQUE09]|uniref:non-ribosomal peptide synthetase n=1 Tax=Nostoc sp. DedQUE09 TaxID=3075394 RepID=UPI002AD2FA9E|nr:amino acid adenylation domain-containing protein [Nostoc sp. DedQUE09]MDZ7949849.1 amino acid adenylation domain-containing protein [Nostoc sp. DedQUE09]